MLATIQCITIIALAILPALAARAASCDAPDPKAAIATPAGIAQQNAYSGVWGGTWLYDVRMQRVSVCAKLYVTDVKKGSANVFYCTGTTQGGPGSFLPACLKYAASFSGSDLVVPWSGAPIKFHMASPTMLNAEYDAQGRIRNTDFQKEK